MADSHRRNIEFEDGAAAAKDKKRQKMEKDLKDFEGSPADNIRKEQKKTAEQEAQAWMKEHLSPELLLEVEGMVSELRKMLKKGGTIAGNKKALEKPELCRYRGMWIPA